MYQFINVIVLSGDKQCDHKSVSRIAVRTIRSFTQGMSPTTKRDVIRMFQVPEDELELIGLDSATVIEVDNGERFIALESADDIMRAIGFLHANPECAEVQTDDVPRPVAGPRG